MREKENILTLKFIATSDIHGAIFQYDFVEDKLTTSSLSQIYTYVKEQRQNPAQEVILLDNGDVLQGEPLVYYENIEYEKDNSKKHIISQIMNFMGYNAACIGNHDIATGPQVYKRLRQELNFPWLAANIINTQTGEPYFAPYTIIERRGIKIAIIGLITPAIPKWLPEEIWENMCFEDMIVAAERWMKIIKEKEKPDIVVGLFHAGVDYTYNRQNENTYKNENATLLVAKQIPGFDFIFAGHDHQENFMSVENVEKQKVIILNPQSLANFVSVVNVKMQFDKDKQKWIKKDITGLNLEMNFCETNATFKQKFGHYIGIIRNKLSEPVGYFTRSVSSREALFSNSAFVDLIHTIQLDITGADISFAAPLSFDTKVKRGPVFIRDMFKLYKFENLLYVMRLKGYEIKNYLEFSYALWFNTMENENDFLLNFRINYKGELILAEKYYNFSSAAGIIYEVDVREQIGKRIKIFRLANGQAFDLDQDYKVAINSYRAIGGGGHIIEGAKIPQNEIKQRIIYKSDKDLRTLITEWIRKKQIVSPKALAHWKVSPGGWWYKGRYKSFKVIFG